MRNNKQKPSQSNKGKKTQSEQAKLTPVQGTQTKTPEKQKRVAGGNKFDIL